MGLLIQHEPVKKKANIFRVNDLLEWHGVAIKKNVSEDK